MANKYVEMKKRHEEEIHNFPMFFAFSNKQFEEGMATLGLKPTDTDKIYRLGSMGGFYRKSDSPMLRDMLDRHTKEEADAIAADTTGDGYIYDMFKYELENHEYGYTRDLEDTLNALGLTVDEINGNPALLHGLTKAEKDVVAWYNKHC